MAKKSTARFMAVTAFALVCASVLAQPAAGVPASFKIDQQTFTAAGGLSNSSSFQLWSCLRPESLAGGFSWSTSFQLYSGCGGAIPGYLAHDDDDGDGVPSGVEDGAPNGGDGNGDGIADETQGWVTSLPSGTNRGYVTVEACADAACTTKCQLLNVRALREQDLPYQSPIYEFPFGLLQFTTHCSPVYIQVLYHGSAGFGTSPPQYVKFGPNPPGPNPDVYYPLPGVTFDTISVSLSEPAVARASFVLTDHQLGDDDHAPSPNGIIIDAGGPAFNKASMVPVLNPIGLGLAVGMLMLLAVFTLRRISGGLRSPR